MGHTLTPLLSPAVWLMALLSGSVAVASCVVNDYFDLRTDTINAPHKVHIIPCFQQQCMQSRRRSAAFLST